MTLRDAIDLGKTTASRWNAHNAPRLAAALAYYSMLSLAPVVVLVIAIYGLAFSRGAAEQQLLGQAHELFGRAGVDAIQALTGNLHQPKFGVPAAIIAAVVVIFGASGVFVELRDSLNSIWDAPEVDSRLKDIVMRRVASVGLVLALGLLLLLSVLFATVIHTLQSTIVHFLPGQTVLWAEAINLALSFLGTAALFALIFKVVPDVKINWRDVSVGAFLTALLFTIGRALLGLYLAKAAVGSAYGAAGSLVAFVVWIYYSAQIFFFGAILTRVYASRFGSQSNHGAQR